MSAYRAGDAEAFSELFDRYESKLRHFLSIRLGRHAISDLEDIFQIVWLKVHQARNQFDAGRRFSAWFFSIAWNCLYDRYRQISFDEDEGDWETTEASQLSSEAVVSLSEDLHQLEKLFEHLTPKQREILLLSDFEGLRSEEISGLLKISATAVRQNFFRARQERRKRWKNS